MKQNRCRKQTGNPVLKRTLFRRTDDGVSSVVGEMLLLAVGVILVAVFAASLMGLLPGDRDDHVDAAMDDSKASSGILTFYHKGGDAIDKGELRVLVYPDGAVAQRNSTITSLKDSSGADTQVFNLGCVLNVTVTGLSSKDQVRLATGNTIIYTGVVRE
ncbi:MAG TPA: type IV pilin N-terminal domain-containing protein [Methanocorpusculum sp.]|nr:type IV pilin N-terminal domain-containing protein [Methanocorpusculum sp.]